MTFPSLARRFGISSALSTSLILIAPASRLEGADPEWRAAAQLSPSAASPADEERRALAIQDALLALRTDPEDPSPNFFLGETYFQIGNLHAARHHLDAFLASAPTGPDSTRAAYLSARILLGHGLRLRATQQLRRLARSDAAPPEAWHDLSLLLRQDRMVPEAIMAEMVAAERAEAADPYLREAFHQWKELGRFDQALAPLESIAENGAPTAEDFFQLGLLRHRLGRFERAGLDYEQALARNEWHPEAHYNLSLVDSRMGDTESAIYHLEQVLRLRPAFEPAYFELARLFLATERRVEAVDVFKRLMLVSTDSLAVAEADGLIRMIEREPD
jgi:tetratricopeptide (TPR) repeat protein